MKRIIILLMLILSTFLCHQAIAGVVLPHYMDSVNDFGYGIYSIPKNTEIHTEPDADSPIVQKITWNSDGIVVNDASYQAKSSVIAFVPAINLAGFAVVDETDSWVKIVYNQENNLTGWVRMTPEGHLYSWLDFFNQYGRKNGLYFLKDVKASDKTLYTEPSKDSFVAKDTFTYIKSVEFKIIRGNWALVKYVDIDGVEPIGWLKWRNDDNQLLLFPKFN